MGKTKKKPNPGSQKAIEIGCTCAIFDNCRGEEWFGKAHGFYVNEGCPVHWPIKTLEKTGSVGKINTREWNSTRKGKDFKENQHKKKKRPEYHAGLKRTKKRWNKKKGVQEVSKKGSRDKIFWSD